MTRVFITKLMLHNKLMLLIKEWNKRIKVIQCQCDIEGKQMLIDVSK